MKVNEQRVQIEEVTSELTPAEGVSVEQALSDAKIVGADMIHIVDGKIVVTWYKRKVAYSRADRRVNLRATST